MRSKLALVIVLAAILCCPLIESPAQPKEKTRMKAAWLAEVLQVWSEKDAAAAFALLENGAPEEVGERYHELANHLYNDAKDVPAMVLASRSGIDYCLRKARDLAKEEKRAIALRGRAKMIAYNLGANCWPGWNEPGIMLDGSVQAIGLDAARLNLRLAKELGRPAEPTAHAHWLLGAQLLAAGNYDAAAEEFSTANAKFKEAQKPTESQMAVAYERLAHSLREPKNSAYSTAMQAALQELMDLNNDDARFFADQIRTAEKALLAK